MLLTTVHAIELGRCDWMYRRTYVGLCEVVFLVMDVLSVGDDQKGEEEQEESDKGKDPKHRCLQSGEVRRETE